MGCRGILIRAVSPIPMAFKSSLVSYLFGLMSHLALHKMVEGASAEGAAAMSVGGAGCSVPACATPQSAGRFSEPSLSGGPTGSIKTKGYLCRARKQQS
jgi:hypothetical protein